MAKRNLVAALQGLSQWYDTIVRMNFYAQQEERRLASEERLVEGQRADETRARGASRSRGILEAVQNPEASLDTIGARIAAEGGTFGADPNAHKPLGDGRFTAPRLPRPGQQAEDLYRQELESARANAPPRSFAQDVKQYGGVTMGELLGLDEGGRRKVIETIRQAGQPIPSTFEHLSPLEAAGEISVDFSGAPGPDFSSDAGRELRRTSQAALKAKDLQDLADASAAETAGSRAGAAPLVLAGEQRAADRENLQRFSRGITDSMITALRDVRKLVPGLDEAIASGDQGQIIAAIAGGAQRGDISPEKVQEAIEIAAVETAYRYIEVASLDPQQAELLRSLVPPAMRQAFEAAVQQFQDSGPPGGR